MVVSSWQRKGTPDMKYHINSCAWEHIHVFLDSLEGIHTRDQGALRLFVEAVWFVVRIGCQWRLLPESYGNWRAIHRRFKRWAEAGIWEQLMHHQTQIHNKVWWMLRWFAPTRARRDMEKTAAIKKPWDKAKVDIPQKSMRLLTLWVTRCTL